MYSNAFELALPPGMGASTFLFLFSLNTGKILAGVEKGVGGVVDLLVTRLDGVAGNSHDLVVFLVSVGEDAWDGFLELLFGVPVSVGEDLGRFPLHFFSSFSTSCLSHFFPST